MQGLAAQGSAQGCGGSPQRATNQATLTQDVKEQGAPCRPPGGSAEGWLGTSGIDAGAPRKSGGGKGVLGRRAEARLRCRMERDPCTHLSQERRTLGAEGWGPCQVLPSG